MSALSLFDDFFTDRYVTPKQWGPKVDIVEENNKFTISAELPGFKQKDVKIQVRNNVLEISGTKEFEDKNYLKRERSYGEFKRIFSLGEGIDESHIDAKMEDGVLFIEIGKKEEKQPRFIEIK